MSRTWLIIPEYEHLKESVALAEEFTAAFEYNDFCDPAVYENVCETGKRIETYCSLDRDRSRDTMHGLFFDVLFTSRDSVIRNRSRELVELSFEIAHRLGVKGVVFHTGLLADLQITSYVEPWLEEAEAFWRGMAVKHASLEIYMENTFEKSPEVLLRLKKQLADCTNFKLCLDYGHACLTPTPIAEWVGQLAEQIGHLHINDNDLKADLHLVPGEGSIDWNECRQLLETYHINSSALLELRGVERQRKALEFMKRW